MALRGAQGDHPAEGGKLPKQKPRSPGVMAKQGKPGGVVRGESEGASEGRSL